MKKFTLIISTILGISFTGCIVHRTVHAPIVIASPEAPVYYETPVYDSKPIIFVEDIEPYIAPDYTYAYYYAPEHNFYFNPDSYQYWWYDQNQWYSGYELPPRYAVTVHTKYITVVERDNNPTRLNHIHSANYKQGNYANKIQRVGDNKHIFIQKNKNTKQNQYKKEETKSNYVQQKEKIGINKNLENDRRANVVRQVDSPKKEDPKPQRKKAVSNAPQDRGNKGRFTPQNTSAETKAVEGTPQKERVIITDKKPADKNKQEKNKATEREPNKENDKINVPEKKNNRSDR